MNQHKITCTKCRAVLKSNAPVKPGLNVKCPKCAHIFTTPPPAPAPPPPPSPPQHAVQAARTAPPPPSQAVQRAPAPPVVRPSPIAKTRKPGGPPQDDRQMKIEGRQIYFNAVLGGFGGLLGWAAVTILGNVVSMQNMNVYARDALIGPFLGICIGFLIGSSDGIVVSKSPRRALRGAAVGAILGAIGGLVGLLLGELIFNLAGGGVWPRSLGWAIFGMFVGTSDGFAQKMTSKIRYGILGGLLGGLIGGSTYEALISLFRGNLSLALAVGLILLGACIGAFVGLVESLLRQAWLWFTMGRLEGQTRTLDARRAITLGSSPKCDIVLPDDETIAPVHADIALVGEDFHVRAKEGKVIVSHQGDEKEVTIQVLQPGDRIFIGRSRMVFRTEEKKKP